MQLPVETRYRNPSPGFSHPPARGGDQDLLRGGILLSALGIAGILLGAGTHQADPQERSVSTTLIVLSTALSLFGVGLIISGAR